MNALRMSLVCPCRGIYERVNLLFKVLVKREKETFMALLSSCVLVSFRNHSTLLFLSALFNLFTLNTCNFKLVARA